MLGGRTSSSVLATLHQLFNFGLPAIQEQWLRRMNLQPQLTVRWSGSIILAASRLCPTELFSIAYCGYPLSRSENSSDRDYHSLCESLDKKSWGTWFSQCRRTIRAYNLCGFRQVNMPLLRFYPIQRSAAVVVGAFLMTWPALYNRYPLLYADSMSYLEDGPLVARALFLHKFSDDYGGRSFIYCLGILPLHWNVTPWPIVGLNALLTAYVIWLVVRSILPQQSVTRYFALILPLSMFTGLGWLVGWVMPDILGPVLYLSIYLLVFAPESLSRAERLIVVLIAWWAAASHVTHLILAAGMCVLMASPIVLRRKSMRGRLRGVGGVAMIVLAAAAAHMALHWYLYGEPSLNGKRPPFLMARVIADGPGRWYLQQRCGDLHLAVCAHVHDLPDNVGDFLWGINGIWLSSSADQQERLRGEEMAFVLGTLRAYPREELIISADHFWEQLHTFGLSDYDPNPWIWEMVDTVLPGARARYVQSRQAQETLHEEFFNSVQDWTVMASLVVIAVWTVFVRQRSRRVIGLTAVIVFVVIANAAVTGILSNVEDRYQARVIWLVPLLAGVLVLEWLDYRPRRDCKGDPRPQESASTILSDV